MKKFKFMSSHYASELEGWVNAFVEIHNVVDIQFQFSGATTKTYAVMIVYEE